MTRRSLRSGRLAGTVATLALSVGVLAAPAAPALAAPAGPAATHSCQKYADEYTEYRKRTHDDGVRLDHLTAAIREAENKRDRAAARHDKAAYKKWDARVDDLEAKKHAAYRVFTHDSDLKQRYYDQYQACTKRYGG